MMDNLRGRLRNFSFTFWPLMVGTFAAAFQTDIPAEVHISPTSANGLATLAFGVVGTVLNALLRHWWQKYQAEMKATKEAIVEVKASTTEDINKRMLQLASAMDTLSTERAILERALKLADAENERLKTAKTDCEEVTTVMFRQVSALEEKVATLELQAARSATVDTVLSVINAQLEVLKSTSVAMERAASAIERFAPPAVVQSSILPQS